MGDLEQHEAFLRAIFDAPEDDTARLVYADYLQENGQEKRAQLIRVQCELARLPPPGAPSHDSNRWCALHAHQTHLQLPPLYTDKDLDRGFPYPKGRIHISGPGLNDVVALRWSVVNESPHWFSVPALEVTSRTKLGPDDITALFRLPFLEHVTEWNLAGCVVDLSREREPEHHSDFDYLPRTSGFQTYPAVSASAVNVLTHSRGALRIVSLDLRHNKLDTKAARALARSPHLKNLKRLELSEGNSIGKRVWQKVIERFGAGVVS